MRGRARVLSKEFEVSDKGAGKWLKGEAIPETSKLPLLASFLGVSTEWLMSGVGSPSGGGGIHIAPIAFRNLVNQEQQMCASPSIKTSKHPAVLTTF